MTEIEKVVARAIGRAITAYKLTGGRLPPRTAEMGAEYVLADLRKAGYLVLPDRQDPTSEMLARGAEMHRTSRSGDDETLVHDIWQAMWDAMIADTEMDQ